MRVVVTGGAGFIGSHLVDKLMSDNHEVTIIDNLSTGKKQNLNPRAHFYLMDIGDHKIYDLFQEQKPEMVFHLAAQSSVNVSINNPVHDAQANIVGSLNVFDAAVKAGIKKVIYSSSAAVYGCPRYFPIDEDHSRVPLSPYGLSKYIPEQHLKLYKSLYGLDYTILRYANVYGERQDASGEGGVIAIFMHKAVNNQIPVIYGDGHQTRDFIYVQDVVNANYMAMNYGSADIFNIGTGIRTSVSDLWTLIKKITSCCQDCIYQDERPGDIKHSILKIDKARENLNWNFSFELKAGLEEMFNHINTPAQEVVV